MNQPGYPKYFKQTTRSISISDVMLLVVDATTFNADAEATGWKEQLAYIKDMLLMALTYGLSEVVVAVNKLDKVHGDKQQGTFEAVVADIKKHVEKWRLEVRMEHFVPVSGWEGRGVSSKSEGFGWHKGPSLMEVLDQVRLPFRPVDLPFRFAVRDVYKISGVGTVVVGKVATGAIGT